MSLKGLEAERNEILGQMFYLIFLQIEIAAFMGFWGLTIDTVTTIILVIAIGLTVDYSVHIAHGFMASRAGKSTYTINGD